MPLLLLAVLGVPDQFDRLYPELRSQVALIRQFFERVSGELPEDRLRREQSAKVLKLLPVEPVELRLVARDLHELLTGKGSQRVHVLGQLLLPLELQLQLLEGGPAVLLALLRSGDHQLLAVAVEVDIVVGQHVPADLHKTDSTKSASWLAMKWQLWRTPLGMVLRRAKRREDCRRFLDWKK